jgi:16S rRNA A1518/A1519 N6-dimethyltransferase RsmA/KsgA/DIM1 with predicted DNA glycosylase/AP lyase activity
VILSALRAAGIDTAARAEQVEPQQYLTFANALKGRDR